MKCAPWIVLIFLQIFRDGDITAPFCGRLDFSESGECLSEIRYGPQSKLIAGPTQHEKKIATNQKYTLYENGKTLIDDAQNI